MSPETEFQYMMRQYMFTGWIDILSQMFGCICHMTEMKGFWTQNRVEDIRK